MFKNKWLLSCLGLLLSFQITQAVRYNEPGCSYHCNNRHLNANSNETLRKLFNDYSYNYDYQIGYSDISAMENLFADYPNTKPNSIIENGMLNLSSGNVEERLKFLITKGLKFDTVENLWNIHLVSLGVVQEMLNHGLSPPSFIFKFIQR